MAQISDKENNDDNKQFLVNYNFYHQIFLIAIANVAQIMVSSILFLFIKFSQCQFIIIISLIKSLCHVMQMACYIN